LSANLWQPLLPWWNLAKFNCCSMPEIMHTWSKSLTKCCTKWIWNTRLFPTWPLSRNFRYVVQCQWCLGVQTIGIEWSIQCAIL
jgi:hypothetical protein